MNRMVFIGSPRLLLLLLLVIIFLTSSSTFSIFLIFFLSSSFPRWSVITGRPGGWCLNQTHTETPHSSDWVQYEVSGISIGAREGWEVSIRPPPNTTYLIFVSLIHSFSLSAACTPVSPTFTHTPPFIYRSYIKADYTCTAGSECRKHPAIPLRSITQQKIATAQNVSRFMSRSYYLCGRGRLSVCVCFSLSFSAPVSTSCPVCGRPYRRDSRSGGGHGNPAIHWPDWTGWGAAVLYFRPMVK